ncbi:hydrolases or acyltransferases (alpha/beta hydrolase superfamily) [Cordyceps militaris CM01]|uniref:Hydrolases or acyltransferases (Alpha/beta hydrolase superfamily) n=1 Tax=Cordyceps militaris (strain CM01) TaxID=983644 RepID=G3J5I9_CORMM|nr:hydrolases or acyltransferases (alpha/beta hydrolase superfamily) [Cordyceps militaris CM01]EGX96050.1 hydrolases or acyltransferases (alpha/beta hydrolase superfamily) [Cordyceps militaris CM01]
MHQIQIIVNGAFATTWIYGGSADGLDEVAGLNYVLRAFSNEMTVFAISGLPASCETWCRAIGDLTSGTTPLIISHGGPVASYECLSSIADLTVPLVFYDQLGNGQSTHLRTKNGDEAFWLVELFTAELEKPLAAPRACGPACSHLRRLVIARSSASMDAWRIIITTLRDMMPAKEWAVFDKADETDAYEGAEYEAAIDVFYLRHLSFVWTEGADHYRLIAGLYRGTAPTLLINGSDDEAQGVAKQPSFDLLGQVKWVTLDKAAHFSHVDQREKNMQHVSAFLAAA